MTDLPPPPPPSDPPPALPDVDSPSSPPPRPTAPPRPTTQHAGMMDVRDSLHRAMTAGNLRVGVSLHSPVASDSSNPSSSPSPRSTGTPLPASPPPRTTKTYKHVNSSSNLPISQLRAASSQRPNASRPLPGRSAGAGYRPLPTSPTVNVSVPGIGCFLLLAAADFS